MDVMKPDLEWIKGKCYRKNPVTTSHPSSSGFEEPSDEERDQDNGVDVDPSACKDDADYEIEQMKSGQFRTHFYVASAYYGVLIGTRGASKARLENETRTRISVPKHGVEGEIVITGETARQVSSARTRIEMVVLASRQRKDFTHFVSFCLAGDEIKKQFATFKELVLLECSDCRGVEASLFQKPEKLHLTLTTTALMSDMERKRCADLLKECVDTVIKNLIKSPLTVRLEGIEYMNDDPAEVDVLYGKVIPEDSSDTLQDIADTVVDFFIMKGEVNRQYDNVKLHATLMNTLFRNKSDDVPQETEFRQSKKQRDTFDARKILEVFGKYYFGTVTIEDIHLSQRYSTGSDGYYKPSAKVSLPK